MWGPLLSQDQITSFFLSKYTFLKVTQCFFVLSGQQRQTAGRAVIMKEKAYYIAFFYIPFVTFIALQ